MSECLEIHARGLFPRTSAIAATARGLMGQQNRNLEIRLENISRRASEYELSLSGMSESAHYQKCRLNSPRKVLQGGTKCLPIACDALLARVKAPSGEIAAKIRS